MLHGSRYANPRKTSMNPTLLTPLRRLACFLLLNAVLANAALAAPATKDNLLKYFELANSPALATHAINTISAAKAQEWQNETDPALQAKKKAQFDRFDAIIRKHVTWKAVEPIMVESFQQHLQEEDVLALIAYGQSASGRVRFEKLAPAMVKALPQLMAFLEQRIDEISDRQDGKATAERPLSRKAADGSKEALAYTLLLELPGARTEFKVRMVAIESAMLKNIEMFSSLENTDLRKRVKAMAATLQRELTYEEIAALQAQLIQASVSEAELALLIADHRQPALHQLLAKQKLAEREAGEKANKFIGEKLFPTLMAEFSATPEQRVETKKVGK